ncbi:MAG: hypothetical protein NVS4B8_23700 [Herpetosiphon sp.]
MFGCVTEAVMKPVVVRKSVSLPADLWEDVLTLQHAERIVSQAEAMRQIVVAGIKALHNPDPKSAPHRSPGPKDA